MPLKQLPRGYTNKPCVSYTLKEVRNNGREKNHRARGTE